MPDESALLDSGWAQAAVALIGGAAMWWLGRRSARQADTEFQTEVPRANVDVAHQPLFGAVTAIADALENHSENGNKPVHDACTHYLATWTQLNTSGRQIFLEPDISAAAVALRKFIERSVASTETQVHCSIVGPGFRADPETVVGNKADRLFDLPRLIRQPASQYMLIVARVIAASPDSEAFRWQLRKDIPLLSDILQRVVHPTV